MEQMTHDWCQWIELNLSRGCTPRSMIEEMVRNGFSQVHASASVNMAIANHGTLSTKDVEQSCAPYTREASRLPEGRTIHTFDRNVTVSLRMKRPHIAVLHGVLSNEECDELIRRAGGQLKRSTTVDRADGSYQVINERTSEGMYFAVNADPFIARLDRRIAELMNWPVDHGEGLQVLHYSPGGEYRPHFDYFPFESMGSHTELRQGGQRIATLIMYLNDVEHGGETIFPEVGLDVTPVKGSAVYFEYLNSLGQQDRLTLHGGAPVLQGEKWIMTKWVRQRRLQAPEPAVPRSEAVPA